MRYLLVIFILLSCSANSFAQKKNAAARILTTEETTTLFSDSISQLLDITLPIFRVYTYSDKSGFFYTVLTESTDRITADGDTLNTRIRTLHIQEEHGKLRKLWEMNDKIENEESSIRFWTKFVDFVDYEGDGLVQPILVYGTSALNGYDDGRIKILIYYKGQKIAIRHQNGILDDERMTQVDRAFYDLPQVIQEAVKEKIVGMESNDLAIFPYGWQDAMKEKKLRWRE